MSKDSTNIGVPHATTTVITALTSESPTVLGRKLRQVTIAHIIALEALDSPLVSPSREHKPTVADNLRAIAVLATAPVDVIAIAGAANFRERIEGIARTIAIENTPDAIADACIATQTWLYQSFESKLPVKTEERLGEPHAASVGLPNSLDSSSPSAT